LIFLNSFKSTAVGLFNSQRKLWKITALAIWQLQVKACIQQGQEYKDFKKLIWVGFL